MYLSGGTIRDYILGRKAADLDITVQQGAVDSSRFLIRELGEGAFVLLGTEEEEAARVVWRGLNIDFSSYRKKAITIEDELHHRDFTINSMAVALDFSELGKREVVDPLGGYADLQQRVLRCCPDAFADDPLRMLRGFRLCGQLGFEFASETLAQTQKFAGLIHKSAAERISYEMNLIMSIPKAARVIKLMAESGLLWQVIPELEDGVGLDQPGFHHEDVFHHNLLALELIENVLTDPEEYFGSCPAIENYVSDARRRRSLRWAALFHDLGKPATCSSGTIKTARVTFYNHDRVGRAIFEKVAKRLRWSRGDIETVGGLIEMHMHPFHLSNARRHSGISRKALLKIYKKAGAYLPGLFILAMADSLAGQGELKPEDMEDELSQLYHEVLEAVENFIKPVLKGDRLLTGNDLIETWNLTPGPVFRKILNDVELAMVEGRVNNRSEAMQWVDKLLKEH